MHLVFFPQACMWRGLNPQGLEMQKKVDYLHSWTAVSSVIHEPSVSLLLHLPVLLSYTKPSNRELLNLPATNGNKE
ncbi:LETM1 domain-containing protein [Elysia marginata]|uniref:LETM1 domain-containing protein n=1 Tax=Elysia marginata TaxID=1093978 RepID=A0AAV4FXZ0_9GAST|nr:LETM1 domain-containing protein [Elysia marginata]